MRSSKHLPRAQLEILKVAEESEREQLRMFVDRYGEENGDEPPDNGGGDDDGGSKEEPTEQWGEDDMEEWRRVLADVVKRNRDEKS